MQTYIGKLTTGVFAVAFLFLLNSCNSSSLACADFSNRFEARVLENQYFPNFFEDDHYNVEFKLQKNQNWAFVFKSERIDSDPGICDGFYISFDKKEQILEIVFRTKKAISKDLGKSWKVIPY